MFFLNEICQSNKQYVFCLKCSKIIKQFPVILKYQVLLFHQQFRALEHCAIMVNTNKSSVSVMPSSKQYKNLLIIFQFGDIIKVTKFTTKYTKYFKLQFTNILFTKIYLYSNWDFIFWKLFYQQDIFLPLID